MERARDDAFGLQDVVFVEDIDELVSLIGLNRPVDNEQRLVRLANGKSNADEHARRQQPNRLAGNASRKQGRKHDQRALAKGRRHIGHSQGALQHHLARFGVRKQAAHGNAARRGTYLVIDEIDQALVGIVFLPLYLEIYRQDAVGMRFDSALIDRHADFEQRAIIHVEISVDRIERDHRRQKRLVLIDQVAQGQVVAADLPVDG